MILYPDLSIKISIYSSAFRFKFADEYLIQVLKASLNGYPIVYIYITGYIHTEANNFLYRQILHLLIKEIKCDERDHQKTTESMTLLIRIVRCRSVNCHHIERQNICRSMPFLLI